MEDPACSKRNNVVGEDDDLAGEAAAARSPSSSASCHRHRHPLPDGSSSASSCSSASSASSPSFSPEGAAAAVVPGPYSTSNSSSQCAPKASAREAGGNNNNFGSSSVASRSTATRKAAVALGLAASLMLVSGTFDTTATKAMNRQRLPPCADCPARYFAAPLLQSLSGYLGQSAILIAVLVDKQWNARLGRASYLERCTPDDTLLEGGGVGGPKPRPPHWLWMLPLLFDYAATCCLNISTMLARASTVQMLRSSNIVLAFFLSAFALQNKVYVHQLLGVILIFLGLILVGLYAMLNPETETNYGDLQWVGLTTALAGTALGAFQWVLEEAIFRHYSCRPMEAVGWMGLYGLILGSGALLLAHVTHWEDVRGAFYQLRLKEGRPLLALNLAYVVSLSVNTASGLAVTQLASSLLRTIVNAGRTASVWMIEMCLDWAQFSWLNTAGLLCITCAIALYNYNYFTYRTDHWRGDRLLRSSAACLPNKHEVSRKIEFASAAAAATPGAPPPQSLGKLSARRRGAALGAASGAASGAALGAALGEAPNAAPEPAADAVHANAYANANAVNASATPLASSSLPFS